MNLNSIIKYKSSLMSEKLEQIAKGYFHPEKTLFQDDKDKIEAFIATFKSSPIDFFTPEKVTIRDRLYKTKYNDLIKNSYTMFSVISLLIGELSKEHEKLNGYELSKLNDIQKLRSLVKQKIASLNLSSNKYKFVWAESFETEENLIVTDKTCFVSNGLLSLPIKSKEELNISSLSIGSVSIGKAGSTDPSFSGVNDLENLLSGRVFQWENTTNSNAVLEIEILFDKEEIVNALNLRFSSLNMISSAVIKGIKAYSKGSLLQLLQDEITVDSTDNLISFYPVLTNKLTVVIDQPSSYDLNITSISTIRRSVISLDKLKVYKIKYLSDGALESKEINVLGSPSAVQANIDILETNNNLFSYKLLYSVDNKSSFNDSSTIASFSNIKNLYWKLLLTRNDASFENSSSVYSEETNFEYETQLSYVGGIVSPTSFNLAKKSLNDNIFVMQPRVMKRGNKKKEFVIGKGTGTKLNLKLGMEITPDLAEKAIIKVNDEIWDYAKTLIGAGTDEKIWTLSKENYKTIIFGDDIEGASVPDGAVVTFSLDNEKLRFIETDKGYYASFDFIFDPDKDNIDLYTVSESKTNGKFILTKNKKVNKLPYQNIVVDSLKIVEKNSFGSAYSSPVFLTKKTFVDGHSELTSSGDYSIDYINGYLYSKDLIPSDDIVSVLFSFYPVKNIPGSYYNIVYENSIPKGIIIKKDLFPAEEKTDIVAGSAGIKLKDLTIEGLVEKEQEASLSSSTSFSLERNSPIPGTINVSSLFSDPTTPEEIEYIDGHSEFYGLIKVTNEYTTAYSGSGIKSFVVSGATNYYSLLGISFEDTTYFLSEKISLGSVSSPGDWYIDPSTGTVSVWVSAGLPAGIKYSYYYKNSSYDPLNKYSVDYKEGIIYTVSDFSATASVTYKSVNFYACYDIVTEIKNFSFDKNNSIVTVKTENNFSNTNLIKIVYPVKQTTTDVSDLKEYYSPLIKSFDFRFS